MLQRPFSLPAIVLCAWPTLVMSNQEPGLPPARGQASNVMSAEAVKQPPTNGAEHRPSNETVALVRNFFERIGKELGINNPAEELDTQLETTDPDFPDRKIVKVQQVIKGIPIFGAYTSLAIKEGKDVINHVPHLTPPERLKPSDTAPSITADQAVRRAIEEHDAAVRPDSKRSISKIESSAKLFVFDPARFGINRPMRLAWKVRVDQSEVFIDARNGTLLFQYHDIRNVVHRTTFDLGDQGQEKIGHVSPALKDDDPVPKGPISVDANQAHNIGAIKISEYFENLGRDSYDGIGGRIQLYVCVGKDLGTLGRWSREDNMLLFQRGVPQAIDIMGHEFTHGVIQYTADLAASNESGALDEALADFFGVAIKNADAHNPQNWKLGDVLTTGPLRDMANPHFSGFNPKEPPWPHTNIGQPDHYSELVNTNDDICGYSPWPENEQGCPHLNSGIFNKATYLASRGGDHHGFHVKDIGTRKVARILFRSLVSKKLGPSSSLNDAAQAAVYSCKELVGKYGIQADDCTSLTTAFEAVGLSAS